jgi:hypothetical protein
MGTIFFAELALIAERYDCCGMDFEEGILRGANK